MIYPNVILHPGTETTLQTFSYRLSVGNTAVVEKNFATAADAAWACDKARLLLKPFLRRSRPYNFPDRLQLMSESERNSPSQVVLDAYVMLCAAFPDVKTETEPAALTVPVTVVAGVADESERLNAAHSELLTQKQDLQHRAQRASNISWHLNKYVADYPKSKAVSALRRAVDKLTVESSLIELDRRRNCDALDAVTAQIDLCRPHVDLVAELADEDHEQTSAVSAVAEAAMAMIPPGVFPAGQEECVRPVVAKGYDNVVMEDMREPAFVGPEGLEGPALSPAFVGPEGLEGPTIHVAGELDHEQTSAPEAGTFDPASVPPASVPPAGVLDPEPLTFVPPPRTREVFPQVP